MTPRHPDRLGTPRSRKGRTPLRSAGEGVRRQGEIPILSGLREGSDPRTPFRERPARRWGLTPNSPQALLREGSDPRYPQFWHAPARADGGIFPLTARRIHVIVLLCQLASDRECRVACAPKGSDPITERRTRSGPARRWGLTPNSPQARSASPTHRVDKVAIVPSLPERGHQPNAEDVRGQAVKGRARWI
jgi:hypothetical protein